MPAKQRVDDVRTVLGTGGIMLGKCTDIVGIS